MSVLQTAAQITANEKVWIGDIPARGGLFDLAVYDNETAVPANITSIDYMPSADVGTSYPGGVNSWRKWTGDSTVNLYQNIDENPPLLGTDDYIYCGPGYSQEIRFRVGSGAALTGKRILGVEVIVYATAGATGGGVFMNMRLTIGFGNYGLLPNGGAGVLMTENWAPYTFPFPYNPATKKPWTIADIQTFASSNSLFLYGQQNVAAYTLVDSIIFRVHYCDENRLAVGILDDTGMGLTPNAWNTVAVTTPTGGAWTKDASARHLYVITRNSDKAGTIVIPTLRGAAAPNPARGFSPVLDSSYGMPIVSAMGSATATVFGLVQRTSAPADSVDSQPYSAVVEAKVYNGQGAQQEFSAAAAVAYKMIRGLAVKPNSAVGDLLVKIKRRSDNVQLGSTLTLTVAAVAALPDAGNGWKSIISLLSSAATLAAATQYYVEITDVNAADTGTSSKYWSVLTLDVGDATTGVTAGFGGTTDRGTINGAEADRYDIPVLVSTVPTAPANPAVTQLTQALTPSLDNGEVDAIEYLHLVWDVTSLGASFTEYEVQRSEDGGTTWVTVKTVTTESTHAFDDYETLRGVSACYRVRVVRTDGAFSDWTSSVCETADLRCCEMLFTSNADPTLNVAYNCPSANDYKFLDADDVVFQQIYLRDKQVAFTPTERRGIEFTVPLIVSALAAPSTEGVAAFDDLRALSVADVPYVCVLDPYGERFLAKLRVPTGHRDGGTKLYVATIIVTEIDA